MKKLLNILVFALILNISYGQQFTAFYGDYLGQTTPTDTPIIYAPNLISSKYLEHSSAVFSEDGNTVVWCSIRNNVKKLFQMQRINKQWTKPELLDLFQDNGAIASDGPIFFPGTNSLFFNTAREKSDSTDALVKGQNKIWHAELINGEWTEPRVSLTLPDGVMGQISFTKDSTIYYLARQEGAWHGIGIFYSNYKNGNYQTPHPMPLEIDESFQNWTPFVAADGTYLIYSKCVNQGDYGDLYISYSDDAQKKWSIPQNMGAPINSGSQERFPYVSPDGKYLFFTRPTEGNSQDVFWVAADVINELKLIAEWE